MSQNRIVLETAAFLDSPQALAVASAPTRDIQQILYRFLQCCYEDAGKVPRLLEGDELRSILCDLLPRHFGTKDRLAAATQDVLAAYLEFLGEREVVIHAYELRAALDAHMADFCHAVDRGIAHQAGVADTGTMPTVRHRGDKVGRNDPCPCGSGKKFKKCCQPLRGS